ncbi:MAG: class I SAM-dependent methyltransferase [Sulfuriflexus sp.]|nr:class I SAM-dependent methyltransferase [Sulfuriflexus sp.]
MSNDELQTQWDARYAKNSDIPQACQALREFSHLLPAQGHALDLASGMGGNALLLAKYGLTTSAWDLSPVGIEKLNNLATQQSLIVDGQVRDIINNPPAANSFDVIVVSYFLERQLFPALLAALKPSGLLFYETFVRDKPQGVGPSNPDYLLEQNELLALCDGLVIRAYREEGLIGDVSSGVRNVAMLVGEGV